jgi:hypothetical protein
MWYKSQHSSNLDYITIMTDSFPFDENYNADLMDAMADIFEEQQESMHETNPEQWEGYDAQA